MYTSPIFFFDILTYTKGQCKIEIDIKSLCACILICLVNNIITSHEDFFKSFTNFCKALFFYFIMSLVMKTAPPAAFLIASAILTAPPPPLPFGAGQNSGRSVIRSFGRPPIVRGQPPPVFHFPPAVVGRGVANAERYGGHGTATPPANMPAGVAIHFAPPQSCRRRLPCPSAVVLPLSLSPSLPFIALPRRPPCCPPLFALLPLSAAFRPPPAVRRPPLRADGRRTVGRAAADSGAGGGGTVGRALRSLWGRGFAAASLYAAAGGAVWAAFPQRAFLHYSILLLFLAFAFLSFFPLFSTNFLHNKQKARKYGLFMAKKFIIHKLRRFIYVLFCFFILLLMPRFIGLVAVSVFHFSVCCLSAGACCRCSPVPVSAPWLRGISKKISLVFPAACPRPCRLPVAAAASQPAAAICVLYLLLFRPLSRPPPPLSCFRLCPPLWAGDRRQAAAAGRFGFGVGLVAFSGFRGLRAVHGGRRSAGTATGFLSPAQRAAAGGEGYCSGFKNCFCFSVASRSVSSSASA